jgi:hypothetical protein
MILTITTEYDTIFLVANKPIDIKKIDDIKNNLEKELKIWFLKRERCLKDNNIDLDDLNFKLENLQITQDRDNIFYKKRVAELSRKQDIVNEFHSLNPKPDHVVLDNFLRIGFSILTSDNSNININIRLGNNQVGKKIDIDIR